MRVNKGLAKCPFLKMNDRSGKPNHFKRPGDSKRQLKRVIMEFFPWRRKKSLRNINRSQKYSGELAIS